MAPNEFQIPNMALNYNPNVNFGDNMMSMMQSYTGGIDLGSGLNVNCVWSLVNNVEQLGSDNAQQQASAFQNLLNNMLGMLTKLGDGEAAAAGSEVKKNQSDAEKTVKFSESEKEKIQTELAKHQENIDAENKKIETANQNAEELQKQLEEEQKKIQEFLANINALQQQLGAETDPTKQKTILGAITNELTAMNGSFELIATIKESLAANCSQVEDAGKNLENLATEATETVEGGTEKLETIAAQGQQDAQNNSQSQGKAPVNEKTSLAAAEAAAAASSNPLTGSTVAQKLYRTSADQGSAAGIRTVGSAAVWTQIAQSISNISSSANILSTFNTSIGSAFGNSTNLIGSWANTLTPMITSLGSIDTLQTQINGELTPAIQEDNTTVDAELEKQGKKYDANSEEAQTNTLATGFLNTITGGAGDSVVTQKEQVNNLKTPQVKVQFGL